MSYYLARVFPTEGIYPSSPYLLFRSLDGMLQKCTDEYNRRNVCGIWKRMCVNDVTRQANHLFSISVPWVTMHLSLCLFLFLDFFLRERKPIFFLIEDATLLSECRSACCLVYDQRLQSCHPCLPAHPTRRPRSLAGCTCCLSAN